MSFFNEANEEAYSIAPENAATGPRVGFLQAWEDGYNAQVRASAVYGIENQMFKLDDEQVRAMKRAGIEDAPSLAPADLNFNDPLQGMSPQSQAYMDVARFYTDGGDPAFATQLEDYDKRITELQQLHPQLNLKTSRDMFDSVRASAQEYENRAVNSRHTMGGAVGSFLGGAVGALNPNSDPWNFLTLPFGGAGRTALTRVLGQGAAQGIIEGVNQITGVQEQRRILGLEYGLGDAITRVGSAVVGGAALQGAGEAVVFGARRFFRSTPNDVAPMPDASAVRREPLPDTSAIPPQAIPADETLAAAKLARDPETYADYMHEASPLSGTRPGRARTVLDVDYMTSRMDAWDGEMPSRVLPKTDTMITLPTSDYIAPDFGRFVEKADIDEFARRIDPDTFRQYDTYAQRKSAYKARLEEVGGAEAAALSARIDEVDARIYALMQKAEETGGKRAAKLRNDAKALEAEKQQIIRDATGDTPEVARFRRLIMREDEKMREMAPLVSRAYARARNKWDNTKAERAAVYDMVREGRQTLPLVDEQAQRVALAVERTLADDAPILRGATRPEISVKQDADAADIASAVIADNMKIFEEAVEQFASTLDRTLAEEGEGFIEIQGQRYRFDLDKDTVVVPSEEGTGGREISIRQLLEEDKQADYELEAVTSCSLRKTS